MTNLQRVSTPNAPQAIGPYSQAIAFGELIFTAGQIPLDPSSGELVDGDIRQQTRQVLQNLRAVLRAAGSSPDAVIKTTVFMRDLGEFAAMNEVYGEFFADHRPARSTVQVAALPKDADVEIEVVAVRST